MSQLPIITDFTAGELSPRMAGRNDLALYSKGSTTLENWVPFLQGGVTTRPGLKYIGGCKTNATGVRLYAFNVSDTVGYVLEMGVVSGVGYLRFWYNDALVESTPGVPMEFISTAHDVSVVDFPYVTAAQIAEVQFAQDGPDLYMAHRTFAPRKLSFVSGGTFTIGIPTMTGNSGKIPFQTTGNYPGCVAVWGGRLWWAGTTNQPQTVWASETYCYTATAIRNVGYNNYFYFDTVSYTIKQAKAAASWTNPNVPEYEDVTTTKDVTIDSNAMQFNLGSDQLEKIMWLAAGKDLIIGCAVSEFIVPAGVTALTPEARLQTRYGSAAFQAHLVNQAVLFVQGGSKRLREYYYQNEDAAYQSPDLTFHAEHIMGTGIVGVDFAQSWQPMIYCVRSDGEMAVLVYSRGYEVQAWCRYVIDTAHTNKIESVAVIVDNDGNDNVYVSTLRGSVRYIEKLDPLLSPVYNLDSYSIVTKATTNTIARFAGLAVKIVSGATVYDATGAASTGVITMPTGIADGTSVGVGLAYTCYGQTNKVPFQMQTGSGHMQIKRVIAVFLQLLASYAFKLQTSSTDAYPETISLDTSPFTGTHKSPFSGNWDKDGYIVFKQDSPLPATILAISPEVE